MDKWGNLQCKTLSPISRERAGLLSPPAAVTGVFLLGALPEKRDQLALPAGVVLSSYFTFVSQGFLRKFIDKSFISLLLPFPPSREQPLTSLGPRVP